MEEAQGERGVLIVEEAGDFSRALAIYLADLGLRVSTASNWTEALDKILDERPESILINPDMHTVTGEALLGFLREEGDLTPVVVVFDHLETNRIEMLKSLGANEFVRKTDAFYQIAQAISRVLPEWSAERAPVMTDEEFQQIVEQRLNEVYEESKKNRPPVQSFPAPGTSLPDPETASESVGRKSFWGSAERASSRPVASGYQGPGALPLPPAPLPLPPHEVDRQRVRRRRRRSGSQTRRVFAVLFAVCLLAGAIYIAVTKGLSDFIKAEEPAAVKKK
ncbi:MAG: response regulator [Candidatus Latescibacteria bacterium]|nr:response regulator [Candidatus Latescibacterota bacterium]